MSLLTIIIPTRNRQNCLLSMLNFLNDFKRNGYVFQTIIVDNSDAPIPKEDLESFELPIEYYYSSEKLSVIDNFNLAIPFIKNKYVCFIGDDDLISRKIFELVELMNLNNIDAAIVSNKIKNLYFWPGVTNKMWGNVGGTLFSSDATGNITKLNVNKEIEKSRKRICDGPLNLPRAYSGIISTQVINKVINKYEALFGGCSPDIYSSTLLAHSVDNCVSVEYPFIIPGASKLSTSAGRSERTDIGKLKDNDHTGRFKNLVWNKEIPDFYSPFTVWAQSLSDAEKKLNLSRHPNALPYLYAKCMLFARSNNASVIRAMKTHPSPLLLYIKTGMNLMTTLLMYAIEKVPLIANRNPGGAKYAYRNLNDSQEAIKMLDNKLCSVKFKLK